MPPTQLHQHPAETGAGLSGTQFLTFLYCTCKWRTDQERFGNGYAPSNPRHEPKPGKKHLPRWTARWAQQGWISEAGTASSASDCLLEEEQPAVLQSNLHSVPGDRGHYGLVIQGEHNTSIAFG